MKIERIYNFDKDVKSDFYSLNVEYHQERFLSKAQIYIVYKSQYSKILSFEKIHKFTRHSQEQLIITYHSDSLEKLESMEKELLKEMTYFINEKILDYKKDLKNFKIALNTLTKRKEKIKKILK